MCHEREARLDATAFSSKIVLEDSPWPENNSVKEFLHQPCLFNFPKLSIERRKFVRAEWFIHGCTTLLKMRSSGNSKRSYFQTFWSENNTYWSYHSARNNSRALAIFRPISTFGRPKSILVGQIYYACSMGWQLITYKNVLFSKNGRPISDPYFYHCYGERSDLAFCNAVCML